MKIVLIFIIAFLTASCASPPDFKTGLQSRETSPINNVYMYSFLDLRVDIIGRNTLDLFEKYISHEFKERGIATKLLSFNTANMGGSALLEDGNGVEVPIGKVIETNIDKEMAFSTDYRLIIFPSYVRTGTGIVSYQIRWDIVKTKSGERIWSANSWTSNTIWMSNDEIPEKKAKVLVNGLFSQLESEGLVTKIVSEATTRDRPR